MLKRLVFFLFQHSVLIFEFYHLQNMSHNNCLGLIFKLFSFVTFIFGQYQSYNKYRTTPDIFLHKNSTRDDKFAKKCRISKFMLRKKVSSFKCQFHTFLPTIVVENTAWRKNSRDNALFTCHMSSGD